METKRRRYLVLEMGPLVMMFPFEFLVATCSAMVTSEKEVQVLIVKERLERLVKSVLMNHFNQSEHEKWYYIVFNGCA